MLLEIFILVLGIAGALVFLGFCEKVKFPMFLAGFILLICGYAIWVDGLQIQSGVDISSVSNSTSVTNELNVTTTNTTLTSSSYYDYKEFPSMSFMKLSDLLAWVLTLLGLYFFLKAATDLYNG